MDEIMGLPVTVLEGVAEPGGFAWAVGPWTVLYNVGTCQIWRSTYLHELGYACAVEVQDALAAYQLILKFLQERRAEDGPAG
jgi:hypothetical protein